VESRNSDVTSGNLEPPLIIFCMSF